MPETTTIPQNPATAEGSKKLFDDLLAKYGKPAMEQAIKSGTTLANPNSSEQEKQEAKDALSDTARDIIIGSCSAIAGYYATQGCAAINVAAAGTLSWLVPICTGVGATLGAIFGSWLCDGINNLFKKYESPYAFCNLVPNGDERQWCTTVTTWWKWHGQPTLVENEFNLFKCWKDNGFLGSLSDKDISWNVVNAVVTSSGKEAYRTKPYDDVNKAGIAAFAPIRFARFVLTQQGGFGMLAKISGDKPDLKALACVKPYTRDLSYLIMQCLTIEETVKSGNYSKYDSGEINYNKMADGSGEGIGGNKALEIEAMNKAFDELAKNFDNDFNKVLEYFNVYLSKLDEKENSLWYWLAGGGILLFLIGLIVFFNKRKKSSTA